MTKKPRQKFKNLKKEKRFSSEKKLFLIIFKVFSVGKICLVLAKASLNQELN